MTWVAYLSIPKVLGRPGNGTAGNGVMGLQATGEFQPPFSNLFFSNLASKVP